MAAPKKPWGKFFWSDWMSDAQLRRCSPAARALWIDMLCIAAQHEPVGYVAVKGEGLAPADLGRMLGFTEQEATDLIAELERNGVFSRDRKGRIYSRRMIRDAKKGEAERKSGAKGGNPALKGDYNQRGYVYLMGRRADGRIKIGISVNPANRLKKVRAQYRADDIEIMGMWPVENMGSSERTLHQTFAKKGDGEWFSLTAQDIENISELLDPKGSTSPHMPEARGQRLEIEPLPSRPTTSQGRAGQVDLREVEDWLVGMVGDDQPCRAHPDISPIVGLINAGYSRSEIALGIRTALAKGVRARQWSAFVSWITGVRERAERAQQAGEAAPQPKPAPVVATDEDWRKRVGAWQRSMRSLWVNEWGPRPDMRSTRVPRHILAEFDVLQTPIEEVA